ncbi:hypothetical protein CEXT_176161 [Caerostris extrusa]|uniref:Uncharacterized protein n=1 Tax=Caerostris extrusa TaxID=172846 RepID=A0AAV4UT02_CAEEX|nr:hypothetical protein CEXT_176161 [Caerostris extrusa]
MFFEYITEPERQVFKKAHKFLAAGKAVNCRKFLIFPGQKFCIHSPPYSSQEANFSSFANFKRAGNSPVLHVYDTAKAVRYERLSKTGKICVPGLERTLHGSGWLCIIKSGAPFWERINLCSLCPDILQP